ncbi:MAG: GGDEF domain-containing protein [Zoogloea sp.]|nr:GGDEF domain-containing protein [Zoogloea sp.]
MPSSVVLATKNLTVRHRDENPWLAPLAPLLGDGLLHAEFQPIMGFRARHYLGYEGLIRGPQDSPVAAPLALFSKAERLGLTLELERACRHEVFSRFAALRLPGKLFINSSPSCLHDPQFQNGGTMKLLRELGLSPNRVVIEITENQKITDFGAMRDALAYFRGLGYSIAIDDLGEGFSNLRMWTEVHPDYLKIDRHFINGISSDALKFQLVRAIHCMAETCGASLIAEGIETAEDFLSVRDIGIAYGQGYFIERPSAHPELGIASRVSDVLSVRGISVFPGPSVAQVSHPTARALLRHVEPALPVTPSEEIYTRFELDPQLLFIPVVKDGHPLGLIHRHQLIGSFARPFSRELYGRRNCTMYMEAGALVADQSISVQELSRLITRDARNSAHSGFILTDGGRYAGVGNGLDLMALITDLQIRAARYANPLTQLPGNVPLDEHIERLNASGAPFAACYCDLDAFKAFNDVYGYRCGDDLIRITACALSEVCDASIDFLGHIGGDDFMILFQSKDWEKRCRQALEIFEMRATPLFRDEHRLHGGIHATDRLGRSVLHPLPCLSIGAVAIQPGWYASHREISGAVTLAKHEAKRQPGNALFIERRRPSHISGPD